MTTEQKAAIDAARARHQAAIAAAAGATEATQKTAAEAAVAAAAGPDHVVTPDGRVQMLTPSAFKKLKDGARTKGRQELMVELNEQAKQHGFESYEAMMLAAAAGRNKPPVGAPQRGAPPPAHSAAPVDPGAPPPPPPRGKADRKAWDRYERERKQWAGEKAAFKSAVEKANKRSRSLERERDELAARGQLERIAILNGVKDVDYAISLLRRHVSGMNDEQLQAFDETKFFSETMKASHPYLYGENFVPATTGQPGGSPPAPKPGAKPPNGVTDVRQMTDEQFKADLRRRGLSVPTV